MPKYNDITEKIQSFERRKESMRKYRKTHKKAKSKFEIYRTSARQRGLEFTLSKEQFYHILDEECFYCSGAGFGVDRIDSSVGYIIGNVVSCCSMCNYMKQGYSLEDFIERCKLIAGNFD